MDIKSIQEFIRYTTSKIQKLNRATTINSSPDYFISKSYRRGNFKQNQRKGF